MSQAPTSAEIRKNSAVPHCAGARLDWVQGSGLTGAYACEVRTGCFVRVLTSNVNIAGTTGAVWFTVSDTGHVAWPTTGVADSAGSFVVME